MSQKVECPSCGKRLVVLDFPGEAWLTCPRCLGKLPRPQAASLAGGAPLPCPSCAADLPPGTRICPSCGKDVPWWAGDVPLPDADARKDSTFIRRLTVPLAVVGAAGIGLLFLGLDLPHMDLAAPFLALGLVTAVSVVISMARRTDQGALQGFARVVMGGLAVVGAIAGILFILAVSAFVYLLVVCSTGGGFH